MKRQEGYYWCKWDGKWDVWIWEFDDQLQMNQFYSPKCGGLTDDGSLFDEINENRITAPDEHGKMEMEVFSILKQLFKDGYVLQAFSIHDIIEIIGKKIKLTVIKMPSEITNIYPSTNEKQ